MSKLKLAAIRSLLSISLCCLKPYIASRTLLSSALKELVMESLFPKSNILYVILYSSHTDKFKQLAIQITGH